MPRIALSPSTQTWNVGHYSGTNEQDVNYEIASLLAPILRAAGVECDIMTAGRGDPGSGYVANADQSNRQGPYLAHVCLHTDAGGATGTTAFYYPGSVSGENLARAIYDQLAPLSPGADHGARARADLYELSATTAISVLVETAPHDRAADAAWIQSSIPEIAQAYARGILGWLAAGGYITYTQEDDMPITQQDADLIAATILARQVTDLQPGGGKTTLGETIAEARAHHLDVLRTVEQTPEAILDTPITRGGRGTELGPETSLRAMISHADDHTIQLIDRIGSTVVTATGADPEVVKRAVREAIESLTVTVEVAK